MHSVIRDLAAGGRIVFIASTDLAELTDLCDRVGTPSTAIGSPNTA
jgi:ABC-type sugar transport system ATPase subunit